MPFFRIEDWDAAYANMPNIPNGETWPEKWADLATDYRAEQSGLAKLEIVCGEDPREKMDLFVPTGTASGLFVFVHGGYWMRFDKSYWSHLAKGALARGWAVAVPSYPLCPDVGVGDISRSVAKAIESAAGRIVGPIRLAGHSAGGQIVTRLLCGDSGLPPDIAQRVERVMSISGVHDLRPLLRTALNATLGLDEASAARESPALLEPVIDVPVICWVGANERSEFVRQNALLANIWRGLGLATEAVEEPDRHHFDVVDGLGEPESPICKAIFG
jgi:acetyl esterase/lipase